MGLFRLVNPDSKVDGANMGLIWGRRDPVGPQVGLMNFAIWVVQERYNDIANTLKLRIFLH